MKLDDKSFQTRVVCPVLCVSEANENKMSGCSFGFDSLSINVISGSIYYMGYTG